MPQSLARRAIVRPARVALLFALIVAMPMVNADVLDEAVTLIEKGDVRAAELVMKQGLQDKPHDPELRFLLGKLYLDAGSLAAAEKELRLARSHGMPGEMVLHPPWSRLPAAGKVRAAAGRDS